MKTPNPEIASEQVAGNIQLARLRLTMAQSHLKLATQQARLARRRHKEAKQTARCAKKQAKLAKREFAEAKLAVAKAEARPDRSDTRTVMARTRKRPVRQTTVVREFKTPAEATSLFGGEDLRMAETETVSAVEATRPDARTR